MRIKLLLGIFCSSLFFSACAQNKKTVKASGGNAATSTPPTNSNASAAAGKPGRDITAMTMRRSGCYGRCPIYQVHLFSDGRAKYIGERFTENMGTFEKNIGAAKVQAILRQAQALRVDTCSAEYPMMIADLPGLSYTFTRPQGTQSISNATFGPRYLVSLAADVDSLVRVDKTWRKTAEAKRD